MANLGDDKILLENDPYRLAIDRCRLEIEWGEQPKRVHYWAEKKADADTAVDEAKDRLAVVRAELYKDVSSDPAAYDMKKATESSIEAAILVQLSFKAAQKKFRKAQHTARMMAAYVVSLSDRRKALEKTVDLWLADYFSEPKESKFARERKEEAATKHIRGVKPKKDE